MSHSVLSKKAKQRTRRKGLDMAGLWIAVTRKTDRMFRKVQVTH